MTAILAHDTDQRLRRGDAGLTRVMVAMFAGGAAIFALLYGPQAVLPQLSSTFHVTPAGAGLAMSVTAAALAVAVIPASVLSQRWGRARVLVASVSLAALLGVLLPLSPTYGVLLGIRTLQGFAVAGMPAVAMAYLADEIHPSALVGAVGTFVAGNGVGGVAGRMLASAGASLSGWRFGLAAVGALSVAGAIVFALLVARLPNRPATPIARGALRRHLADPRLLRLYLTGFVLMGGFSTIYNYLTYRLVRPPFALAPAAAGLVFLAYVAGTAAAAVAGRLADRHGAPVVLRGAVLLAMVAAVTTLPNELPAVLTGLVLVTVGFFAAHVAASGWVARVADTARAQAAGMYLFAYYAGSSLGGWIGGLVFERTGWPATVAYVVAMFALALALSHPTRSSSAPGESNVMTGRRT
ncbi:MFS transporter [Micromonospora deserti]|uniref:MFS transporter n=1 Tax=Micromonospora deserti TaxID=2070366 RepID=A0A2W2DW17_9ACTN|nr:MFS transporter [Micromonospora deserti]PZF97023.1 MFS transporter [Micromonospora deserti]